MREIRLTGKELTLEINGIQQLLKFTIGVLRIGEGRFGSISSAISAMGNVLNCAYYAVNIVNAAIAKYNKMYNMSEPPAAIEDILMLLSDNNKAADLKFAVRSLFVSAQPEPDNNGGSNNTEPTTAGFVISALHMGFTLADVENMTLKEFMGYIKAYTADSKKNVKIPEGVKVDGIGNAADLINHLA